MERAILQVPPVMVPVFTGTDEESHYPDHLYLAMCSCQSRSSPMRYRLTNLRSSIPHHSNFGRETLQLLIATCTAMDVGSVLLNVSVRVSSSAQAFAECSHADQIESRSMSTVLFRTWFSSFFFFLSHVLSMNPYIPRN